jgi:hypothetical protein
MLLMEAIQTHVGDQVNHNNAACAPVINEKVVHDNNDNELNFLIIDDELEQVPHNDEFPII